MVYLKDYIPNIKVKTSYGMEHIVPLFDDNIEVCDSITLDTWTIRDMYKYFGDRDVSIDDILDYLMIEEL